MDKRSKEALAVKRAEQAFDHKRRTIGLFGGPLSALRSLHPWASCCQSRRRQMPSFMLRGIFPSQK